MLRSSRFPFPSSSSSSILVSYSCCYSFNFSSLRFCSGKSDTPGGSREMKTEYRPRVRPRRIIMPIDFDNLHSSRRTLGKEGEVLQQAAHLRKRARAEPTVKLGELPEENTFADMFSAVLENVRKRDEMIKQTKAAKMNEESNSRAMNLNDLRKKMFQEESRITEAANAGFLDLSSMKEHDDHDQNLRNADDEKTTNATILNAKDDETKNNSSKTSSIVSDVSYKLWDALEQVQVASPFGGGLGVLSASGYSLVQLEVTSYIAHKYPRLRSRHIESLLHSVIGFQPMVRLGLEIGLVSLCNLETDAALWKELCVMHQRENHLRNMFHYHKSRFEAGQSSNQLNFYGKHLKWLSKKIRLFPTDASTLLPRIEWIRNTTLAFIGWIELSEGEEAARRFVQEKICALFDIDEVIDEFDGSPDHVRDARQMRAAHRKSTTSNISGAEAFEDPFERYSRKMLAHLACQRVVDSVKPDNALKEAQIILNYSPFIPRREHFVMVSAEENVLGKNDRNRDENENRDDDDFEDDEKNKKVVKFDIRIRTTTAPILESDTFSTNHADPEEDGYLSTKCFEADLIVFEKTKRRDADVNDDDDQGVERVIGTGIGMTEQESMQACCLDFVRRYYFTNN